MQQCVCMYVSVYVWMYCVSECADQLLFNLVCRSCCTFINIMSKEKYLILALFLHFGKPRVVTVKSFTLQKKHEALTSLWSDL